VEKLRKALEKTGVDFSIDKTENRCIRQGCSDDFFQGS